MLRWRCLEAGCDAVIEGPDEEGLVEAVNAHVRDAHASFELEDIILAVAEEVPDPV
jgi:hypothetical protein